MRESDINVYDWDYMNMMNIKKINLDLGLEIKP